MKLLLSLALTLAAGRLASGKRLGSRGALRASKRNRLEQAMALQEKFGSMVQSMLTGKGHSIHNIAAKMQSRMSTHDALPKLERKLPADVLALVHMASAAKSKTSTEGQFSEVSLSKARVYMNNMMYDSWLQLDNVTIECKEFEESNRETFGQVVTDLEHIGSDLADRERMKVEAEGGIAEMSLKIKAARAFRRKLKREFMTMRQRNSAELQLRTDDQDVFDAVLNMTKCPNPLPDNSYSFLAQMSICETSEGTQIELENAALNSTIRRSPKVEKAILEILDQAQQTPGASPAFLQIKGHASQGSSAASLQAPPPVPVNREPNPEGQWKKCRRPHPVICGLLHDTMALQWGKFKDLVDELTTLMEHNADAYRKARATLNEQIASLRASKMKHQEMLGEAISEINSLTAETREKEQQHRDLEEAYEKKMKECKARITEILFTNICAVRTVRNQLMEYSTITPPSNISDCDFTDWSPGECSVDCDDGCPDDVGGIDVEVCGGMQRLTREIVVSPDANGMACPPMSNKKKCNQFKCPVDCEMSAWSGFSACSKECGGGTQGTTRAVLTKPRNGGSECDTTLEERSCNTGSCDRDCTLAEWTPWEPCSMACGGGLQKRVREVVVPIRANGKCPAPEHPDRLEMQTCNSQPCQGDEICIAKQDLVIAIDGSGSLKQEGFEILRNLSYNLTSRYQAMYYGQEEMKIGVVLFGNGEYKWKGWVTDAIEVQAITGDLHKVRTKIQNLTWQRGFTNMMQAFKKADLMLEDKGRKDAQSAVLVLSDGKYTNAFRTSQKVQQLKDKNIQIYMAPVASFQGEYLKVIKGWASSPWETNYERIPGLEALQNNEAEYAQKLLVKFCPRAISPSLEASRSNLIGFLLLHEGGKPDKQCGKLTYLGKFMQDRQDDVHSCFAAARDAGFMAFIYTHFPGKGWCSGSALTVDQALWNKQVTNSTDYQCPQGGFIYKKIVNTYIIQPQSNAALELSATL